MQLLHIYPHNIARIQNLIMGERNGFLLCQRGEIKLIIEGREHVVRPHSLCILPAFIQLSVPAYSDDLEAIVAISDDDFVLTGMKGLNDAQSIVDMRFHPLLQLEADQQQRVEELIAIGERRMQLNTVHAKLVVDALVQTVCYEIFDIYDTNYARAVTPQTRKDIVFHNFLTALYKHFREHRDVAFYAALQCLTPRYFSTLIHEQSGRTASDWIVLFVTLEAKHLLTISSLSVKEIAQRLNFPTQSFFCRYFKQYAGCTPLQYRNEV